MKVNFCCRLQRIIIDNVKNVGHGEIRFPSNLKQDIFTSASDILGVYGQNGSGKTTLIFVVDLLKELVMGHSISKDMDRYIKIGTEFARVEYEMSLETVTGRYLVNYAVMLKKKYAELKEFEQDRFELDSKVYVAEENIQYKKIDGKKGNRFNGIIEYKYENEGSIFLPEVRYREFIGKEKSLVDELRYWKNITYKEGRSFIFNLAKRKEIINIQGLSEEMTNILVMLQVFGTAKLFVLSNVQASIVNANIRLPMSFYRIKGEELRQLNISINLTDETYVLQDTYELIQKRFSLIDRVLCKIIPGMTLKLVNRGIRIEENGKKRIIVELVSVRNNNEIPLRYESDGIKKLVYVIYSLIEMYNDNSITVAIDELDSGVFEYLLGEILSVLQERAKGQLIFTSHNLRALEVLDKKNILFSTTNENNRYIRFKNIKGSNNLRDVYYQDILLGGQDECIYEPTSQSAIRRAFKKARAEIDG